MVDTDPGARTLTAQSDPVDNLLFQIARNAQLIDLIFHDVLASTLPVWRRLPSSRKPVFFQSPIPPTPRGGEPVKIRVQHSHPGGTIHLLTPQLFRSPYG